MLPRPRQPRLRQGRGGRRAVRRVRARRARALDRRRAVGPRLEADAGRRGALRAADGGRDPALPVHRAGRRRRAALPSGRDDARREPAARADAGRARLLGRRGPLAERVRRRGRDGQDARRVDRRGADRVGRVRLPAVAIPRRLPQPAPRGDRGAGDVPLLLPPPLPVRPGRVGAALAAVVPAQPPAGGGRGVRREVGLRARRVRRAGAAVAAHGRRPARLGLGADAVLRLHRRGAPRDARGRGHHRPLVVREDPDRGARRAGARAVRLRRGVGSAGRQRGLHADARPPRRRDGRHHRHAPRRRRLPHGHGRGRGGDGPRLARGHRAPAAARRRDPRAVRRAGRDRRLGPAGARDAARARPRVRHGRRRR